jgi:peroxin-16
LRKSHKIEINIDATVTHLQTLLQVLEYTSVLSEYSANRFATDFGRWIIIGILQIAKAVIKLILLLKYNQGLTTGNPILPLDRRTDLVALKESLNRKRNNNQNSHEANVISEELNEGSTAPKEVDDPAIKLKRSGRVMRSIDNAPSRGTRNWLLPNVDPRFRQLLEKNRKDAPPTHLSDHHIIAEILHISRPVLHLCAMGLFGTTAWTPFFLSLGMDLGSLKLLHEPHDKIWNLKERIELGQRSFALILYLLRSPFYDRYTKEKILTVLSSLANKIPLFGRLIQPMVVYLPEWQKTYFYVWGA